MYTQYIDLNIIPSGVKPVVHVSQYDNNFHGIICNLYKGSSKWNVPSSAGVTINGRKPDGTGFMYSAAAIDGNTVDFTITEQMTAVAGETECEVKIRTGSTSTQVIGTLNFILDVEKSPMDDSIISETDIPLIEQAVDIASDLAGYIQTAVDSASSATSSASAAATSAGNAATSAASAASDAESVEGLYDSIVEAKTAANTAAAAATEATEVLNNLTATATTLSAGSSATASYSDGVLTLGIPQGAQGESGVSAPLAGFFTMWVDDAGNLYAASQEDLSDAFSYDSETGNLYMLTEDGN